MSNRTLNSIQFPGLIDVYKIPLQAPEYSTQVEYKKDDYVTYQGDIYKCVNTTFGLWDPLKWIKTTLAQEIQNGSGSSSEQKLGEIFLNSSLWEVDQETGLFSQQVDILGVEITEKSKIDLQFSIEQMEQLRIDKVVYMLTENDENGQINVYSCGSIPSIDMSIQCTVTETIFD